MAMMLGYLKGVAAKALAKPVSDCVLSVSFKKVVQFWHVRFVSLSLSVCVHLLIGA